MKEELKIVVKDYIPEELISDLKKLDLEKKLNVNLNLKREDKHIYNFTGPELSDIIIYVQQHTIELFVGGILVTAAYDLLKSGIKILWTGISKLAIKKIQSSGKQEDKIKRISLRISGKKNSIEILYEGDVDDQLAEKLINESFDFIRSEKLNQAMNNPDNLASDCDKPTIYLIYNKEKEIWEPENFGEQRKRMDELKKWVAKKFRS
jgi:hypothetical protein